jgi:hypothetical protein
MPQARTPYLIIIAALLLGLLASVGSCRAQRELQRVTAGNVAALLTQNEIIQKNAEGQSITSKRSLLLQEKEFTKIVGVKDSTIRKLQAAVKAAGKNTSAAVVFTATTKDKASGKVDSVAMIPGRTVVLADDTIAAPTYYGYIKGPNFKGLVVARPDSISLISYEVTQSYTVAFTKDAVQITSLGMNTVASDVQSFQLPLAKKPKRGVWAIGGGVVGTIGTLLLLAL